MRTVSVLFPTTGRPERARACLGEMRATTGTDPAEVELEVIAAVDRDPETALAIEHQVDRMVVSPQYLGCSRGWNNCLAESRGSEVVFAADDLVWEDGWLRIALDALDLFDDGWGLVGFNDGHWDGDELSTHYLMSRRFIIEVLGGVVAWEAYEHSFNDAEVCERAKRADRFVWAEDAHVKHEHWTYGDREKDETDQRMLTGYQRSLATYERRKAAGFPIDYPPVITS